MLICEVIGHVWATKKQPELEGMKLMVVRETQTNEKNNKTFVAADTVGAGVGEQVLVVDGSTARRALGADDLPVDCAIVGIIDTLEVEREKKSK
ncbi:MAG: EutN/CcmL family microcompartment protein [Clostridiales bacterium]|nr:EutN/CcmL family microcompartment protein [Clostridiales bacterium]